MGGELRNNVPNGKFLILRCDFGSETPCKDAVTTFWSPRSRHSSPALILCHPVPPSPLTLIHSTATHSPSRANAGEHAWSLLEQGACYQHNVRPIWHPDGATGGPLISHIESLTGPIYPPCSASYASIDGRGAKPVLNAVEQSMAGDAQTVLNLEMHTLQYAHSVSMTDDPNECAALLAESNMHEPRGAYGTPDLDPTPPDLAVSTGCAATGGRPHHGPPRSYLRDAYRNICRLPNHSATALY